MIKSRVMKSILFILCATIFSISALHAQKPEVILKNKPGWHKIGDANVDFKTDRDQFKILGADRFKSLRVKVVDAPLHIDKMQVSYEGGGKEDVALRSDFKEGSKSKVIGLKNNSAELNKVEFVYHTIPNTKADKAHIELWGLK